MGEKKMTAKAARRCGAAVLAATFGVLAGCQSPDSTTSQSPRRRAGCDPADRG